MDPTHDSDGLESDESGNASENDEINKIENLRKLMMMLKENKRDSEESIRDEIIDISEGGVIHDDEEGTIFNNHQKKGN